jgi:ketosteroid isomerase-like protein
MTTNADIVARLWRDLYARDYDAVGAAFTADGEYTDVPSPADDVARGPKEIAARLRLGFERLEAISHDVRLTISEGDTVVTEHVENWSWPTGERVALPFVSIHQLRDGRVVRWWDYWDMQTLMGAAPAWWIEHIMQGYR